MNDLILIFICCAAITQVNQSRFALLLFALLCLSYDFFESSIDNNYLYYISAAFIDLIIIKILSLVSKPNNTNLLLQKICLCFICVNFLGYLIYYLDLPSVIYSFLSSVLYMTVLIIAIFKDLNYGRFRDNWRDSCFYRNDNQGDQLSYCVSSPQEITRII